MKPLSGLDGAFLNLETLSTPMHVGSLHLFDTAPNYRRNFCDSIKQTIASRLDIAPVLRRRLAEMPLQFANPVWIEDGVDLDFHIQRVELPFPGNWQQLQDCVADLHGQVLDRSRPLWMLYVFDKLEGGRKAYYIKIHHALLDGQAGAALAAALFDLSLKPGQTKRKMPMTARKDRLPGTLALAAAAFRHDAAQYVKLVRHLPDVVRTLAGMVFDRSAKEKALANGSLPSARGALWRNASFGPHTPLNITITPERSFAATSLALDEVKAVAAAQDATVNDIVLTLCAGALRRYLARHGGVPRKPLMATMPISLRDPGNREFTTQATLSLVNLATHIADPVKRLAAVRVAADASKSVAKRAKSIIPIDFPTIGGPWVIGALAALYGRSRIANAIPPIANVVISNVPGPKAPLYAAGLRMTGYWPLSIVEHGVGLNITLMSYAGTLGIGFTAARCAVPVPQELIADLLSEFDELKRGCKQTAAVPLAAGKRQAGTAKPPVARRNAPITAIPVQLGATRTRQGPARAVANAKA